MAEASVTFGIGFSDADRPVAAALYDQAFAQKLKPAIPDEARRRQLLARGFTPSYSITAHSSDRLVGLAGFHDDAGSLTGGVSFGSAREVLGLLSTLRAMAVLALLERKPAAGELLMDGIVVDPEFQGQGIGSGLFSELEHHARRLGLQLIRLDVVDSNPRAQALYERLGFEAVKTENVGWLRPIMGFGASTEMAKQLA